MIENSCLLLNAACFEKKQQISIFYNIWFDPLDNRASNQRSTPLEANTLNNTNTVGTVACNVHYTKVALVLPYFISKKKGIKINIKNYFIFI